MPADVRMASYDDIDMLVRARFDYFAAEKWEVSDEQYIAIKANLIEYYPEHLNIDFFAAIAETGGQTASVAFLAIAEMPAGLSFPTGKTGTVLNVLTYPEHRRKGYATAVMAALIGEARRQNLSYIELSASEAGKPLYQKLGFTEKPSCFTGMRLPLV